MLLSSTADCFRLCRADTLSRWLWEAAGTTWGNYAMCGTSESLHAMPNTPRNRGESTPKPLVPAQAPQLGG